MTNQTDIDEDQLLAIEVESVLQGLRIAAGRADEALLRSAVEDLRRTSRSLPSAIGLVGPAFVGPAYDRDPRSEILLIEDRQPLARHAI